MRKNKLTVVVTVTNSTNNIVLFRNTIKLGKAGTKLTLPGFINEQNDKPGYVLDDHLSRPDVATRFKRPTRKYGRAALFHIRSCFGWGLQSHICYQICGSLLHCLSTLTSQTGGIFLLHFPGSHLHRTLSGILPCEARTFLTCGLSALAAAITCSAHL